jgi:hypothetical protein
MSDKTTKKLLRPFIELAPAPMFLSGFFQSPEENFHTSESVEIDIQRDGENVAIAIKDLSTGHRYNDNSQYSNKEFKPPIFKEIVSLNAFQLLSRDPGDNPFAQPGFQGKAILRIARASVKVQNKIRRSIEWMASQVMQTGTLTLTDSAGVAVYQLDFQPKNNHYVTTPVWAAAGIDGLAQTIRKNGRRSPDTLILGTTAQELLLASQDIKDRLKADGFYGAGQLVPQRPGSDGANFLGNLTINNYRYELWGYDGRYVDPQTGESLPYVDAENIIMCAKSARLDLTYGAIPQIAAPDSRALPFLPPRVTDSDGRVDMTLNAWLEPDGQTLSASVASRPLTIPTEIDSFGCLTVATS